MQALTSRPLSLSLFALASTAPLALLGAASVWGGAWVWAALIYMGCLPVLMDRLIPMIPQNADEGAEFPGSDLLLSVVAFGGLVMMPLGVFAIANSGGAAALALFLALGFWLGQVVHPAAHELIHRPNRWLFRLGVGAYVAILFGQHASAHRLVHHQHVATPDDPNSARSGEGFYRFALRAWIGSFRLGWRAEDALRARTSRKPGLHPYAVYIAGGIAALALAAMIAGPKGVLIWGLLALHAQSQILVSDYVQHYGLRRITMPGGRREPVSGVHSWNGGEWFSSAMMLNATRHSDHHAHPSRPYPALRLDDQDVAPRLPWPLPLACMVALVPPLWKRRIRPELNRWIARAEARAREE